MKYDASMTHLLVCVLCFLECVASVTAVRYGDYSVGHMPQYNDQHEEGDAAPGHEDYGDRSPDAPAHLDYKYEEEPQGRSDDLPIKDIVDDRRYSVLRSGHNRDLDKYSLDDTEPEEKSAKRFALRGSRFVKRNYAKRSDSQKHLKHVAIGKSDDNDNVENNSDYVHKHDIEAEGDGMIDVGRFRYRSTTQKKPRRKPRDRAHDPQEWRDIGNNVKLEHVEVDSSLEGENFENKNPRRFGGIIKESMNRNNKNSYEYDEYYDMKRVQHMKSRLPALLKQTTVRTTEAKSASYSEHWLDRRAVSPEPVAMESIPAVRNTTTTLTTTTIRTTSETKPMSGSPSDLSLAEKSRLSILKKAQRKESSRNASSSTKPPVLMQVTRKMQTLVMVEPRAAEAAPRARDVAPDSPERLRRARQLVRQKLVAGARSIHDLVDNWDEMICDYIDVSLLDTDAASYLDVNKYATVLLFYITLFTVNCLF